MKKQIINIAPVQVGKIFALLYFLLSIPFVCIFALSTMFSSQPSNGLATVMMFAIPFMYAFFGFVFTAIGALIYNRVAQWMGGIEYTSVDIAE